MALFEQKAPGIMRKLITDLGLTDVQAAGVLGNLGHETGGFKHYQELRPAIAGSLGGYGWAQWTGPRRRAYFAWARQHNLDVKTDEANYGFLLHELRGPEKTALKVLKATKSLKEATGAFEGAYERAGVVALNSRLRFAERALLAYHNSSLPVHAVSPPPPDIEPNDIPPKLKKTGISEVTAAGTAVGAGGVVWQVWEALKEAPVSLWTWITAAADKPYFWVFLGVAVVAAYLFYRRQRIKRDAAE